VGHLYKWALRVKSWVLSATPQSTKGGEKNFHGTIRDMISSIITRAFFNLQGRYQVIIKDFNARLRHVEIEDVTLSPITKKEAKKFLLELYFPMLEWIPAFF
jgi:hypothetical protein